MVTLHPSVVYFNFDGKVITSRFQFQTSKFKYCNAYQNHNNAILRLLYPCLNLGVLTQLLVIKVANINLIKRYFQRKYNFRYIFKIILIIFNTLNDIYCYDNISCL